MVALLLFGLGAFAPRGRGTLNTAVARASFAIGQISFAATVGSLAFWRGALSGGSTANGFTKAGTIAVGDGTLAGTKAAGQTNAIAVGIAHKPISRMARRSAQTPG